MLSKKQKIELWRIKERYRLSRPWFNLFYKYPPIINAGAVTFFSSFLWHILFDTFLELDGPIGPKVLISSLITGLLFFIFSYLSHKDWNDFKKRNYPEAKDEDVSEWDVR
jgi:hypothetical protein